MQIHIRPYLAAVAPLLIFFAFVLEADPRKPPRRSRQTGESVAQTQPASAGGRVSRSLVAYYSFERGEGSFAQDQSGSGGAMDLAFGEGVSWLPSGHYGDAYGAGYRARNGYQRWGEAVVGEGDDWVYGKYRGNERGTAYRLEGDEGGQAVGFNRRGGGSGLVGFDDDENLYVGRDGDVYKREDDGDWFRHDGGDDWDKIDDDRVDRARRDLENQAGERQANLQERADQRSENTGQSRLALEDASTRRSSTQADPERRAQQRQNLSDLTGSRASAEQRVLQPRQSQDVLGGLERDARARSRGTAKTQQRQTWQSSNRSRTRSSRSYSSRRSYGGTRGGGVRRGGRRR